MPAAAIGARTRRVKYSRARSCSRTSSGPSFSPPDPFPFRPAAKPWCIPNFRARRRRQGFPHVPNTGGHRGVRVHQPALHQRCRYQGQQERRLLADIVEKGRDRGREPARIDELCAGMLLSAAIFSLSSQFREHETLGSLTRCMRR
jgi:hypothetical protein